MKRCIVIAAGISLIFASCGSSAPAREQRSSRELAIEMAAPIRTSQAQRPEWIDEIPQSAAVLSFVGISNRFATEVLARGDAQENGRRQLVDFYGTVMVNKGREYTATYGLANEVFSPQVAGQRLNERIAQALSQALGERRVYWEYFMDENNREYYISYVEMQIDKARVARVIDDFGREEAANLQRQAAAEQDAQRRQQIEKAAEFFGGNLSSTLDL
ncbi:MAG: hypothetical protein LBI67_05360 [Treponema sp.]|jgi:hypothetical protein|nr:hypothetical protein [Treponema sp.]